MEEIRRKYRFLVDVTRLQLLEVEPGLYIDRTTFQAADGRKQPLLVERTKDGDFIANPPTSPFPKRIWLYVTGIEMTVLLTEREQLRWLPPVGEWFTDYGVRVRVERVQGADRAARVLQVRLISKRRSKVHRYFNLVLAGDLNYHIGPPGSRMRVATKASTPTHVPARTVSPTAPPRVAPPAATPPRFQSGGRPERYVASQHVVPSVPTTRVVAKSPVSPRPASRPHRAYDKAVRSPSRPQQTQGPTSRTVVFDDPELVELLEEGTYADTSGIEGHVSRVDAPDGPHIEILVETPDQDEADEFAEHLVQSARDEIDADSSWFVAPVS